MLSWCFISKLLRLETVCTLLVSYTVYIQYAESVVKSAMYINPAVESNEWYQTEDNTRYGTAMIPHRVTRINQTSPCWVSQPLIRRAKGSRSSPEILKAFQKVPNEPLWIFTHSILIYMQSALRPLQRKLWGGLSPRASGLIRVQGRHR